MGLNVLYACVFVCVCVRVFVFVCVCVCVCVCNDVAQRRVAMYFMRVMCMRVYLLRSLTLSIMRLRARIYVHVYTWRMYFLYKALSSMCFICMRTYMVYVLLYKACV